MSGSGHKDDIVKRLEYSAKTATNDDFSEPMSEKRKRHTERVSAMLKAAATITSLREELAKARKALEPFARLLTLIDCTSGAHDLQDADMWPINTPEEMPVVSIRHLRAAATAMGGENGL